MTDEEGIRLAKRVAAQLGCSRGEAERYIAGGWVTVDGAVVEEPATRVMPTQEVALLPGATSIEPLPVTILLHKPVGFDAGAGNAGQDALACLTADMQVTGRGSPRFLKRHLHKITLATPLETTASGLVVYTQDFRLARKLVDERERIEHEIVVEVTGTMADGGLALLGRGVSFNGRQTPPVKASWQSETRLRLAAKDLRPGQVEHMCRAVGLAVVDMKRLRVGRLSMAGLPPGHWRYLQDFERF
jgi:23S rRNA pseudouridine2604 synthase